MGQPSIDYGAIGLTVGLEIHQQLATKTKLFCGCPAELSDEEHDEFRRRLRPTRSELGEVDIAALFEWRKGRVYEYEAPHHHSCLVEADEEPPHPINREAVVIAMAVAKALGSWIVDEVHVMRKIVIDGSNTSGFQRTAIVALGGSIRVEGRDYSIETIVVEEDAARKLGERGRTTRYRLDRLGIPLIEIATGPDMHTPEEAYKVALAIGRLLRLTGKVKRGLGTIRQDLNVSIRGGAKTEIKGVQRLDLIPRVVEYEALRQLRLLEIRDELRRRGVKAEDVRAVEPVDVTEIFRGTASKVVRRAIEAGGVVLALRLPGFHGLLGRELVPGRRLGTELADYARFWGGVGGLFHSDELPKYGITREEVEEVYNALGARRGWDAFVLVAGDPDSARRAIEAVRERAAQATIGVPEETRAANEDGTTRFLRPRPGSARMYPETDIPPLLVTEDMHDEAEKIKPEPVEVKLKRLVEEYGLPRDMAERVISDIRLDLIERLIRRFHPRVPAKLIASIFTVTLKGIKSKGADPEAVRDEHLEEIVEMLAEGRIAKEAVEPLLVELSKHPGETARQAAERLGLTSVSREEAERIVEEIVRSNVAIIKERRERAHGPIMGRAMAKLRGRIDGRIVSELVAKKIKEVLEEIDKLAREEGGASP
ncbi:MAG: Glu-tRNA(Gln) amidotransferase subunit GatE [Desulfurococcales archaeon]|nr:Glu-tRNA(Gln) amidotransferase subunit GatE [Desulfurococcales archaeon]